MGALTDEAESGLLTQLFGGTAYAIVGPIQVKIVSVIGTESAAGTAITTGTPSNMTVPFASWTLNNASGVYTMQNTNALQWTAMPAVTVAGVDLFDSSTTPKRLWYGVLTGGSKTLASGDTFEIAAGQLQIQIDTT